MGSSELDPLLPWEEVLRDDLIGRRQVACEHILAAFRQQEPVYVRHTKAAKVVANFVGHTVTFKTAVVLVLVALSCFERPVWCVRQQLPDGTYPCDLPSYEGFRQEYLKLWDAFGLEAILLSILILLEAGETFAGGWRYLKPQRNWLAWPLLLLGIIDAVYAAITPDTFVRLGPFIRIAIAANHSADVRRELKMFIGIIPGLVPLFILTVLFLSFFSFCALTLFHEIPGHEDYFGSFGMSMWNLLVLQTTSNFPDIMLVQYRAYRVSIIYFAIFILLGTFFLMNLFTAAVYNKYAACEKDDNETAIARTEENLKVAFDLLDVDDSGALSKDEILALVYELRKAHFLSNTIQDGAISGALLFGALDSTGNNLVSKEEFMELCTVLKVHWEEEEKETWLQLRHPNLYHSSWFTTIKDFVLNRWFRHVCDLILLLMCILTIWETMAALNRNSDDDSDPRSYDGRVDTLWNVAEIVFTAFFLVEAFLKIIVHGWETYWREHMNRLEFITAWASVGACIVVYVPNDFDNSYWIRWTLMLRLLGFFRFLRLARFPSMLRFLCMFLSVRHIRIYYETFVSMLPNAARLLKVMFCIVFFYAALGVQLFGGRVTTNPESPYYKALMATDYGTSNYFAMNMNDIPSGLIVMMQLLVVNNWMVFVEGFVAVAARQWVAWIYFISFFLCGVVIGLNVLVSFVLDAFDNEMETDVLNEGDGPLDKQQVGVSTDIWGSRNNGDFTAHQTASIVLNAALLTGTDTGVQGKYRVRLKGYESSSKKAQMLVDMFNLRNPRRSMSRRRQSQEGATYGHGDLTQSQTGRGSTHAEGGCEEVVKPKLHTSGDTAASGSGSRASVQMGENDEAVTADYPEAQPNVPSMSESLAVAV